MRVSFLKKEFLQAVAPCEKVIATRDMIPVATMLHLSVNGHTEMAATNFKTSVMRRLALDTTNVEAGECLIPRHILQTIKQVDCETFEIQAEGKNIAVDFGKTQVSASTYYPEEFPVLPNEELGFDLEHAALLPAMKAVAYARHTDDAFIGKTVVYLRCIDNVLYVHAMDGKILACKSWAFEAADFEFPVSPEFVAALPESGDHKLVLSKERHIFRTPDTTLISTPIDVSGIDPRIFKKSLPKTTPARAIVNRSAFLSALTVAKSYTTDIAVRVQIQIVSSGVYIRCETERGKFETEISCEVSGEATVLLNVSCAISVVRNFQHEELSLSIYSPVSNVLLEPMQADAEITEFHMIAPIQPD